MNQSALATAEPDPGRIHVIARWVPGVHGEPAGWVLLRRAGRDWAAAGFPPAVYRGPAHTPPAWVGEWATALLGWPAGATTASRIHAEAVGLPARTPVVAIRLAP